MQFIDDKDVFYRYLYHNCHCCNAGQSKEERKTKYKLARYFGLNSYGAMKYRDWRPNCFAKHFGYSSWQSMINILEGGDNISNEVVSSK